MPGSVTQASQQLDGGPMNSGLKSRAPNCGVCGFAVVLVWLPTAAHPTPRMYVLLIPMIVVAEGEALVAVRKSGSQVGTKSPMPQAPIAVAATSPALEAENRRADRSGVSATAARPARANA